jgi:iron complex transport system substrate-binding protein
MMNLSTAVRLLLPGATACTHGNSHTRVWSLLLMLATGCAFDDAPLPGGDLPRKAGAPAHNLSAAAVGRFEPGVDYFPDKVEFRHATQLRVTYHGHYKIARVLTNGVGQEFEFVLVQRGTPIPAVARDAQVIAVPVMRFTLGTYRYGGSADALGLVDRLVGYGNHQHATVPSIVRRLESGELSRNFDLQALLRRGTEAHFNWHFPGALSRADDTYRRLGVPLVDMAEHLEPTPLARAEWVKFFALFFNKEVEATAVFDAIEGRYEALRQRVASAVTSHPRVLAGSPAKDGWTMHGGRNVYTRMIEDAGGEYTWHDDTSPESGRSQHFEDALVRASNAEVWIIGPDFSFDARLIESILTDPRYAYIPAVANRRVYIGNVRYPGGPNPWWDHALLTPDAELADHIRMIHPGLLPPADLHFFRAIGYLRSGP